MKQYITWSFEEELNSYDDIQLKVIAINMNLNYGPNEFEQLCLLLVNHWEYLFNRLERRGKKVSHNELFNFILLQQTSKYTESTKNELFLMTKFVIDILSNKGINKNIGYVIL